jgi:hypothetical protein
VEATSCGLRDECEDNIKMNLQEVLASDDSSVNLDWLFHSKTLSQPSLEGPFIIIFSRCKSVSNTMHPETKDTK